jgi:ABC-type branched-subunit amino acid transport system substrate-binding protein
MMIRRKVVVLLLTMIAAPVFTQDPALAHRFNVALVVPLSNATSAQGGQIREGFMLATKERDSHPDQESDGHLGGLDVYVTVVDERGDLAADIARIVTQDEIDIVAAFGSEASLSLIGKLLEEGNVVLLSPGESPFAEPGLPGVAAFIAAYERQHGGKPSSHAAQGYNAARRIDAAVRVQGGVEDTASLRRVFRETARGFTW